MLTNAGRFIDRNPGIIPVSLPSFRPSITIFCNVFLKISLRNLLEDTALVLIKVVTPSDFVRMLIPTGFLCLDIYIEHSVVLQAGKLFDVSGETAGDCLQIAQRVRDLI